MESGVRPHYYLFAKKPSVSVSISKLAFCYCANNWANSSSLQYCRRPKTCFRIPKNDLGKSMEEGRMSPEFFSMHILSRQLLIAVAIFSSFCCLRVSVFVLHLAPFNNWFIKPLVLSLRWKSNKRPVVPVHIKISKQTDNVEFYCRWGRLCSCQAKWGTDPSTPPSWWREGWRPRPGRSLPTSATYSRWVFLWLVGTQFDHPTLQRQNTEISKQIFPEKE